MLGYAFISLPGTQTCIRTLVRARMVLARMPGGNIYGSEVVAENSDKSGRKYPGRAPHPGPDRGVQRKVEVASGKVYHFYSPGAE